MTDKKKCAYCDQEIADEVTLASGRKMYVGVVPFNVNGQEVYLCGDKCVEKYREHCELADN